MLDRGQQRERLRKSSTKYERAYTHERWREEKRDENERPGAYMGFVSNGPS